MFDRKAYDKQYYRLRKENCPEKLKEYNRRSDVKCRFLALRHYSSSDVPFCAHCRIEDIDILVIDHINGGGNEQRRQLGKSGAGSGFYSWLKANNYPEGYQVLCWNCNHKKELERIRRKEINLL